ncbi:MAG: nuclear transport factor 2 family protein [Kiloniellales bacterium]|nr:nuclear transport factor 2 family protein [Kiloniellales bacterium]
MSEQAAVLFANDSFYAAFLARDVAAMEALWAEDVPVACVHPGWHALTDREEVMESWAGILSNEAAPKVVCRSAQAFVQGESAFVVCYEQIGDSLLVATNIFLRQAGPEGRRWRMVHHQAGPCNLPPDALEEEPEPGPVQ